jgi:hypothetical protein
MSIDDDKGPFLDDVVSKYSAKVTLEIGMYYSYFVMSITMQMQRPVSMVLTVKMSPLNFPFNGL